MQGNRWTALRCEGKMRGTLSHRVRLHATRRCLQNVRSRGEILVSQAHLEGRVLPPIWTVYVGRASALHELHRLMKNVTLQIIRPLATVSNARMLCSTY